MVVGGTPGGHTLVLSARGGWGWGWQGVQEAFEENWRGWGRDEGGTGSLKLERSLTWGMTSRQSQDPCWRYQSNSAQCVCCLQMREAKGPAKTSKAEMGPETCKAKPGWDVWAEPGQLELNISKEGLCPSKGDWVIPGDLENLGTAGAEGFLALDLGDFSILVSGDECSLRVSSNLLTARVT